MNDKAKELGSCNVFPQIIARGDYEEIRYGMDLREYFAIMAMKGMIASENENWNYGDNVNMAKEAVKKANALLEELSK